MPGIDTWLTEIKPMYRGERVRDQRAHYVTLWKQVHFMEHGYDMPVDKLYRVKEEATDAYWRYIANRDLPKSRLPDQPALYTE